MNQSVLMNADIDKRAEIDDVSDRSRQFHADFQVVDVHDIRAKFRLRQTVAHVSARFQKFGHDIVHRGNAEPALVGSFLFAVFFDLLGQIFQISVLHVVIRITEQGEKFFGRLVRFRVNGGVIEDILSVADP